MTNRRRRGVRVQRRRKPFWLLPRVALAIFLVCYVLIKSGYADRLEQKLFQGGGDDTSWGGQLAAFFASKPEKPDQEKQAEQDGQQEPPDQITLADSAAPQTPIKEAAVPPSKVTSLTIDGKSSGYKGAGSVYYRNQTDYAIDIPALLQKKSPVQLSGNGVQVLIVHTHGTESYTPDANHVYTPTDTDRTTDTNFNVVRVGDEIERLLKEKGIKTVHSRALHDSPAYNGSYNRALEDIKAQMKENPSIKVVIDVHRDAMITANGTKYKVAADVNGRSAAQLMLVVGTDAGGLSHEDWRKNLAFAAKLQERMNTAYPGIMRPIDIRTSRFNQHVTTGSILLEVGTSGNTLDEALYSAQLFSGVLADLLNETKK